MKSPSLMRTVAFYLFINVSLLASFSVLAEVEILDSGSRHHIKPLDTECRTSTFERPGTFDRPFASAEASCIKDDGTIDVDARTGGPVIGATRVRVHVGADAHFEYRFQVLEVPGAPAQSFIPINVRVKVDWASRLLNESILGQFGIASMDAFLRLRMSPEDDPAKLGDIVEDLPIFTSVHKGLSGCLTIPTSKIAVGVMAVKCVAGVFQRLDGGGVVTLSTVVEVGRTYTIQLGASARAKKTLTPVLVTAPVQIAGSLVDSAPPALKWESMTIQIGTDPAAVAANFAEHAHYYLRRQSHGYEPVEHRTSSPILLD